MAKEDDLPLGEGKQQPGLPLNLYPDQTEKQRDHRPAAQPPQVLKPATGQANMKLAIPGIGWCVVLYDRYFFHTGRSPNR